MVIYYLLAPPLLQVLYFWSPPSWSWSQVYKTDPVPFFGSESRLRRRGCFKRRQVLAGHIQALTWASRGSFKGKKRPEKGHIKPYWECSGLGCKYTWRSRVLRTGLVLYSSAFLPGKLYLEALQVPYGYSLWSQSYLRQGHWFPFRGPFQGDAGPFRGCTRLC